MNAEFHRHPLRYLASNLSIMLGLVLMWRGIWYVLDGIDIAVFGGNHVGSAVIGFILGILILYLPDHDLKEIQRL